jgi:hypothetical protein
VRLPPDFSAALAAGRTVLAPNTEIAAALFDAAEREQRALGLALWVTPRIRDFGSWLREQQERRISRMPGSQDPSATSKNASCGAR